MRRSDKEITDVKELKELIAKCMVCRLGLLDNDKNIYILPMNFGHAFKNGKLEIYFHGATEGKKVDLLRPGNVDVGFEIDCDHALKIPEDSSANNNACDYNYRFSSIIGYGKGFLLHDYAEKVEALKYLMLHQTGREFTFSQEEVDGVSVFKIVVNSYTGKKRA